MTNAIRMSRVAQLRLGFRCVGDEVPRPSPSDATAGQVRVCYAPPEVEDYQENLRKIGDAKERLIASGTYGAVYEITASQTSVGVAKKQRVDKDHGLYEEPIELVKKGAQYHCLMGQLQLGPKMSNCNVQFNSSNMPDLVTRLPFLDWRTMDDFVSLGRIRFPHIPGLARKNESFHHLALMT